MRDHVTHDLVEGGLEKRRPAGVDASNLLRVEVNPDDLMTEPCKASRGDASNVSQTKYSYSHNV